MVLHLPDSWSNWNLELVVFEWRGKPEFLQIRKTTKKNHPGEVAKKIVHVETYSPANVVARILGERVQAKKHSLER